MAKSRATASVSPTSPGDIVISTSQGDIVVKSVPTQVDQWYTISDTAYRPDKDKFVLDNFNKDYPNINLTGSDEDKVKRVYALASRSAKLNEWLAGVNVLYSQTETTPTFYRDEVTPQEYEVLSSKAQQLSKIASERASAELAAAQNYAAVLSNIDATFNKRRSETMGNDKVLKVITLNSTSLPLTAQMAIENFVPAAGGTSPDKKTYAREMLIRFKLALLQKIKADPNFDLEAALDDASTK